MSTDYKHGVCWTKEADQQVQSSKYSVATRTDNLSNCTVLQYVTEKIGGAEGTKLDLDFMDMERVCIDLQIKTMYRVLLFAENGCDLRAGGRATSEDEGVPSTQPDRPSKNGRRQGNQQAERTGQTEHVSSAGGSFGRLHAYVRKEARR